VSKRALAPPRTLGGPAGTSDHDPAGPGRTRLTPSPPTPTTPTARPVEPALPERPRAHCHTRSAESHGERQRSPVSITTGPATKDPG
jgi:hypothetical protein